MRIYAIPAFCLLALLGWLVYEMQLIRGRQNLLIDVSGRLETHFFKLRRSNELAAMDRFRALALKLKSYPRFELNASSMGWDFISVSRFIQNPDSVSQSLELVFSTLDENIDDPEIRRLGLIIVGNIDFWDDDERGKLLEKYDQGKKTTDKN
jgi:hypothetical protein